MFNNNTKTIIAIQQGKEMKCLESYAVDYLLLLGRSIIIIKKTDLFSFYYSINYQGKYKKRRRVRVED